MRMAGCAPEYDFAAMKVASGQVSKAASRTDQYRPAGKFFTATNAQSTEANFHFVACLHTQAAFPQRNEIGCSRENANFVAIFREQTAVISADAAPGIANLIAQH
jgi:hypothetical protein